MVGLFITENRGVSKKRYPTKRAKKMEQPFGMMNKEGCKKKNDTKIMYSLSNKGTKAILNLAASVRQLR